MNKTVEIKALLEPLFDECNVAMKPADEISLRLFTERADDREVPLHATEHLTCLY